jgi:hypothetical protein
MAAIIGGGLALAGGVMQGAGSKKAGNQAAVAAKEAARTQQMMYLQTRADLSPFTGAGASVLPAVNALAMSGPTGGGPDYVGMAGSMFPGGLPGSAGATGTPGGGMTQAELEATPGYQFTRDQGLKAVQSAAASRGLGMSGASLKGAATYATGLADSTYKNQFDISQDKFKDVLMLNTNQQTNLTNQWGRLIDTAKLGATAAAGLGQTGATIANNQGTAQIAQGTAEGRALRLDAGRSAHRYRRPLSGECLTADADERLRPNRHRLCF